MKIKNKIFLIILFISTASFFGFAVKLRFIGANIGEAVGHQAGVMVGRALGSIEGITEGRKAGSEAGRIAGVSAEDTEVAISNKIKDVKELEVLVASTKINDFHSIGNKVDYAALYLLKGDVTFTVDLGKADIYFENDDIRILIPEPKPKLIIDNSQIDKVAEYQEHYFSGSAQNGFEAYLNSMKKIDENAVESVSDYEALQETAKKSARQQVEQLARAVSVSNGNIEVDFLGEEGD